MATPEVSRLRTDKNPNFYEPTLFREQAAARLKKLLGEHTKIGDPDVFRSIADTYASITQTEIADSLEEDENPYSWRESTSEIEFQDRQFGNVVIYCSQMPAGNEYPREEDVWVRYKDTSHRFKRSRDGKVRAFIDDIGEDNKSQPHQTTPEQRKEIVETLYRGILFY